ncbi:DNA cytosine methyltransferase [Streptococcus cristatus]|jgi:DNA (cytosine-5-)-methyltransferase|uniref:DNA cytosine methyltransferase n=1 Tax=Streptococcus cristatus TaxID=45634 RepID=UPI001C82CC62|nr:DNA cytosine methyltransferase [Streptococcus cristatus]MBX5325739.1 DNA cytosine methyltransferase [Streptococcus cristatus]
MINIIDLFSGAGGLTEGFRNQQYKILGHVEKEKAACETLKLREVYYYLKKKNKLGLYNDFLNSKTSIEDLLKHVPQEKLNKILNFEISQENIHSIFSFFDDLGENVDGIIGGPPCQAYSTIGRARNASKKSSDERIYLYKFYIHFLNKYQPKFFIFENVKGLLSFRDADDEFLLPRMKKEFEEAGYSLGYEVLNTKNYGVPQSRERLIIFGVMNEKKELIQEFFKNLKKYEENEVDVKTAFQGLPSLKAGEVNNSYTNLSNDYVEQNFLQDSKTPLTQNIARPNNSNDLAIYKIVAEAKKNGKNIKYSELDSKLKTHKHTDKFLDRFKALSWNSPSHTVVAHISKDGHHYIHPDTKQNRSITVREAARLQGFPDNYYFLDSRTSAFTQIGNAVPPIFSKKMADAILTLEFK